MIGRLRLLLYPFSVLYGTAVWLRNLSFDWGWKSSRAFQLPVICIGNLAVGGTGKTPHTEYLVRLLQSNHILAMVSRGYLRQTKGVQVASAQSTSLQVGDEPMQLKKKFPNLHVVAAEKRVLGIEAALKLRPTPTAILLDDAYQHRYVKPGLSILLIDYNRPIWSDHLLPAGNLREGKKGMERADMIVITKCPENLSDREAQVIACKLKLKPSQKLYFSSFSYGTPYALQSGNIVPCPPFATAKVIAFTAIANAVPFHNYLKSNGVQLTAIDLPDHHRFNGNDIENLAYQYKHLSHSPKWIAVTEKDAVKLREIKQMPHEIVSNVWVVPIEPVFLFSKQNEFNKQIIEYVGKS